MAILLSSPKKRKKTFLLITSAVFVVAIVSFLGFFFYEDIKTLVVGKEELVPPDHSELNINFKVTDLDSVKSLELFEVLPVNFTYVAKDKNGNQVEGSITEKSRQDAIDKLAENGLEVLILEQVNSGTDNPFASYY